MRLIKENSGVLKSYLYYHKKGIGFCGAWGNGSMWIRPDSEKRALSPPLLSCQRTVRIVESFWKMQHSQPDSSYAFESVLTDFRFHAREGWKYIYMQLLILNKEKRRRKKKAFLLFLSLPSFLHFLVRLYILHDVSLLLDVYWFTPLASTKAENKIFSRPPFCIPFRVDFSSLS